MFDRLLKGRFGFLERSLRGTEWSQLLDYVTPSFLEVMPMTEAVGQARRMLALSTDSTRFARERYETARCMAGIGIDVALHEDAPSGLAEAASGLDVATRRRIGDTALALYFGQIARRPVALLDLRSSRFDTPGSDRAPIAWSPRPFYVEWDPAFVASLRDLYAGYYRDDPARFDAALADLHLEPARDVFLDHFGGGDQRAVRFRSDVFHSTFHDVFVRCRDAGRALHPNFIAVGVYLACLYDVLEVLDLEMDVRAAFDRVWPAP